MDQKTLNEIMKKHKKWIRGNKDGERANLRGEDLHQLNLRNYNLREADLREVILYGADLRGTDLCNADLRNADLRAVDFRGAILCCADLRATDLTYAILRGADLCCANLSYADLHYAELRNADVHGAVLCTTKNIPYIPMVCPEEGSFIGWKKAYCKERGFGLTECMVKLEIPEDAKRSSGTNRKCRCNKAKVLEIKSLNGEKSYKKAYSIYDNSFVYQVGKIVEEPNFCEDRFDECAEGIHFFINEQEAFNLFV